MANHRLPLGGIGAGFLLLDDQGRLYNYVPGTDCHGALLANTFPCIRLQSESGKHYTRALYGEEKEGSWRSHDKRPHPLKYYQFRSLLQYPSGSFQLRDAESPVNAIWTFFSPVIPYDQVAAAMPLVVLAMRLENTTSELLHATVMFSVDNIISNAGTGSVNEAGPGHIIRVSPQLEEKNSFVTDESRGLIADLPPEALHEGGFNGIIFGNRRRLSGMELRPHACLAAKELFNSKVSISHYNAGDANESIQFWSHFDATGKVPLSEISAEIKVGVVAVSMPIAPGGAQRFDFVFTWHSPESLQENKYAGSGYARSFKTAQESANHAMKHVSYMFSAVETWQKQLLDYKLPGDFGSILLDSSCAFTTHTQHTPDGGFLLTGRGKDSPDVPRPWDFLSSMALLVFAPHFHTAAVAHKLSSALKAITESGFQENPDSYLETAEIILSAYADVLLLGHRARMAEWLPLIHSMVEAVLNKPLSEHLASNVPLPHFPVDGLGLWAAALNAMAIMAREQGDEGAAVKYQKAGMLFSVRYEADLLQLFHIFDYQGALAHFSSVSSAAAPDASLLAGPCFAKLLDLDTTRAEDNIMDILAVRFMNGMVQPASEGDSFRARSIAAIVQLFHARQGECKQHKIAALLDSLKDSYVGAVRLGDPKNTLPDAGMLSLWAVLQAFVGFSYDALHQTILLKPLADVVEESSLPVFSPLSLGEIKWRTDPENRRNMAVSITLQTPLTLRKVILYLPVLSGVPSQVSCRQDSENLPVKQQVSLSGKTAQLELTFRSPLKLSSTLTVRLRMEPNEGNE